MQFIQHDLGYRSGGEIVEIILSGSAANVRLMDSSNLGSYKSGRQHRYHGGLATKSPVRLQIPSSGNWHVAVDARFAASTGASTPNARSPSFLGPITRST
jgi:hypothetical protein